MLKTIGHNGFQHFRRNRSATNKNFNSVEHCPQCCEPIFAASTHSVITATDPSTTNSEHCAPKVAADLWRTAAVVCLSGFTTINLLKKKQAKVSNIPQFI